ncbi:MAG: DNA-directed RNA polymerase subunit N [Nitrososphaerales archaeon]|jgi:DNA-directed RNA polymerase subunit N|nr:DNA-directed RNA polymerase subunit N [Nitrososphaerales archaeon]HJN57855.1 DNA-directed RNA polymerase subunit N [Nitrososphaerales archaeon]|tara:strand:+ start:577 stop:813 length:237 start_codon:yes stop_codon:yes gene_type:complete
MLKPIRCFTCGSLVAEKYSEFDKLVKAGGDPNEVMNSMKINRYCCRRMLLSNVNIIDHVLPFYEYLAQRRAEFESDTL